MWASTLVFELVREIIRTTLFPWPQKSGSFPFQFGCAAFKFSEIKLVSVSQTVWVSALLPIIELRAVIHPFPSDSPAYSNPFSIDTTFPLHFFFFYLRSTSKLLTEYREIKQILLLKIFNQLATVHRCYLFYGY